MREQHCGGPTDVYNTDRPSKLTALETISRWLILKSEKIALWATLFGLRGNIRTPSIAHWKARGRLYIRRNWTFRYLLRLRRYKRKAVEVGVSRRVLATLSADFRGKGASPTNHCWCQSSSDCPFVWYQNIHSALFSFVIIQACDRQTDEQTDRRTELRLPRPPSHMLAR